MKELEDTWMDNRTDRDEMKRTNLEEVGNLKGKFFMHAIHISAISLTFKQSVRDVSLTIILIFTTSTLLKRRRIWRISSMAML
jgi:hypothetical protein